MKNPPFVVFLNEKLVNFSMIFSTLLKLSETGVDGNSRHRTEVKHDSVKSLKIAFERKFSVNMNSLTHHLLRSFLRINALFDEVCLVTNIPNHFSSFRLMKN